MKFFIYIFIGSLFQALASLEILKSEMEEISFKKKLIFFIVIFIVSALNGSLIANEMRFLFCFVSLILVIYYVINDKNKTSLIYSFNIAIILAIAEFLVTLSFVMFGIKTSVMVNNHLYNLIVNILISLVVILLTKIKFVKKIMQLVSDIYNKNKTAIYYFYILLILFYAVVLKNGFDFLNRSNYVINIIIVIMSIILLILIFVNELKKSKLEDINKESLKYIEKYEKIITEQGKRNHEFKNQLMVIKGYAEMKSPKLLEYLNNIVEDTKNTKSTYLISQLNKFPNGGLKGLLYYKLSIMEDEGIKYTLYCDENVKKRFKLVSSKEMVDITKALGVLIDNAIDAAKKASKKEIYISFVTERGKIKVTISNTYKGKIEIKQLGTGYTTKGSGHGFGLQLLNDIIKKNDRFEYKASLKENLYVINITIKYTK